MNEDILPVNNLVYWYPEKSQNVPGPEIRSDRWAGQLDEALEDSLVWRADDPVGLWGRPSSQPPSPCRRSNTSETDKTDTGCAVACPPGNFCPPGRHTWRSFELFAWKILCSLRRFEPRSVGRPRCRHTRHRGVEIYPVLPKQPKSMLRYLLTLKRQRGVRVGVEDQGVPWFLQVKQA